MYASQPKININIKLIFWGFKVIDVGTPGKLVSSAFIVMIRSKSVSIYNHS